MMRFAGRRVRSIKAGRCSTADGLVEEGTSILSRDIGDRGVTTKRWIAVNPRLRNEKADTPNRPKARDRQAASPEAHNTTSGSVAICQSWFDAKVDVRVLRAARPSDPILPHMTNNDKSAAAWSDVEAKLGDFDRAGLLGLLQDLYTTSKDNQNFLHARFGPGGDVLEPYKTIIERWLRPDVTQASGIFRLRGQKVNF
jgi:hypothetical protein